MDEKEDGLSTLWEGLRSEALVEPTEPTDPFEPPALAPVRRRSLTEKFQSATLSGFIPAFVALMVGVVVGSWNLTINEFPILTALGCLLAVPAAKLLSDLFRIERLSLVRVVVLMILGAGLGAVGMTAQPALLLSWWKARVTSHQDDLARTVLKNWAKSVDQLYLAHLQPETWLVYGLLTLLVLALIPTVRQSAPWLQRSRSPHPTMRVLSVLLILAPWLFLGASLALKGRIAPAELAWLEAYSTPQGPPLATLRHWRNLAERARLADSEWSRNLKTAPRWSTEFQRETEQQCLDLIRSGKPGGYEVVMLLDGLLHRPKELQQPLELAWFSLDLMSSRHHSPAYHGDEAVRISRVLIDQLTSPSLSKAQLQQQHQRLASLVTQSPDPKEELDFALSGVIESRWRQEEFMPMSALALELDLKMIVGPWLEMRKKVDFTNYPNFRKSMMDLSATMPKEGHLRWRIEHAFRACYGLQLRPTLQTAGLILSLRLHKAEHGSYPSSLAALSNPPENLDLDYNYRPQGQTAELSAQLEKGKVTRWVLP